MAPLLFTCPTTHRRAPTPIETDPNSLAAAWKKTLKVECPHCGEAGLRREPVEVRKATLASILRKSRPGVRLNEHLGHPEGEVVFRHACELGAEGIVCKRLGSRYRSGRSPD